MPIMIKPPTESQQGTAEHKPYHMATAMTNVPQAATSQVIQPKNALASTHQTFYSIRILEYASTARTSQFIVSGRPSAFSWLKLQACKWFCLHF